MTCSDAIQLFGEDLRVIAHDPEVVALDPTHGSWVAGGCWVFAEALRRYIGRTAELWSINDRAMEEHPGEEIPIHVVVRVNGCYLDADGAWTDSRLLGEWERPWRSLVLRPFDPQEVWTMQCPIKPVRKLVRMFKDVFGEPTWLT